jgi:hypothetical protein
MRFGAALDLWHKGDLHDAQEEPKPQTPKGKSDADEAREELLTLDGWTGPKLRQRFYDDHGTDLVVADAVTVRSFKAALEKEAEAQDAEPAAQEAAS